MLNPKCFQPTEMAFSEGQYTEQREDDRSMKSEIQRCTHTEVKL